MLFSPEVLQALLQKNKCSLSRTARSLGVSPQYVHQLLAAHGVAIEKKAIIRHKPKTPKERKR